MIYSMRVLRDFENIKKSTFGNFIECRSTLRYEGNCWGKYRISSQCFIKGGCAFIRYYDL